MLVNEIEPDFLIEKCCISLISLLFLSQAAAQI